MSNIYYDAPFQLKKLNNHYVTIGSIFYKLKIPQIVILNSIFLFNKLKNKTIKNFIIVLIFSSKLLMDIPIPYKVVTDLLFVEIENIVESEQKIWKELNFNLMGSKNDFILIERAIKTQSKYYRWTDRLTLKIKLFFTYFNLLLLRFAIFICF